MIKIDSIKFFVYPNWNKENEIIVEGIVFENSDNKIEGIYEFNNESNVVCGTRYLNELVLHTNNYRFNGEKISHNIYEGIIVNIHTGEEYLSEVELKSLKEDREVEHSKLYSLLYQLNMLNNPAKKLERRKKND